jgi:valyl-tRNA synthetase
LYPEYHKPTWFHWLDNVKDWCISRQLWWGHRIPAYKVIDLKKRTDTEVWVVGRNIDEATSNAFREVNHSDFILEQDEDVLDTWFSSGLFPFAVFGWPEKTDDLKQFFPTTLLETGKREICVCKKIRG